MIDGALRWRINAETCYHYWNVIGTDCGRCMAVCPYSHPASLSHNLIRRGNARSGAFRRAANWLDDLYYGKHPQMRHLPNWTRFRGAMKQGKTDPQAGSGERHEPDSVQ